MPMNDRRQDDGGKGDCRRGRPTPLVSGQKLGDQDSRRDAQQPDAICFTGNAQELAELGSQETNGRDKKEVNCES